MTDDLTDSDRVVDGPLLALHDELVAAARRRNATTDPTGPPDPTRPPDPAEVPSAPVTRLATRRTSRLPVRALAAAAAVVLAVVGVLGYGLATDRTHAAADVTVERHGDSITVSLDRNVTVEAIYRALDDTGVDVTVRRRTTGPSGIDRFVGITGSGAEPLGGDGRSAARATFDKSSKVTLELGVAAKGTRPYDAPTDATAHGEPLEGLKLSNVKFGTVRGQIEAAAKEHDVTIRYQVTGGSGGSSELSPDLTVVGASGISPKVVLIVLVRI